MKNNPIPVIDLFAGPGGLGEGFSALPDKNRNRVFRIALSIEKDEYAHQTLELRSFFRQFEKNEIPKEYYQHLRGELTRNDLFEKYAEQSQKAKAEACKIELGNPKFEKEIDEKISEALKNASQWILIGAPPCQAYSLVGRSRKQQSEGLNKEDEKVYLYRAYYRILAKFNPPVFIMENVKGLLSSKVKGEKDLLFKQILADLKNPVEAYNNLNGNGAEEYKSPGYKIYSLVKEPKGDNLEFEPSDFVIKCENFGVPQTRHRVILLGIRRDLKILPNILETQDIVTVEEVIHDLPKLRSGLSKVDDNKKIWKSVLINLLSEKKLNKIDEALRSDIISTIKKIRSPQKDRGQEFVKGNPSLKYQRKWYIDDKLEGFCNHSTRGHIADDLYRYFFASCFASRNKVSPKLIDFPSELLPDHNNIVEALEENKFADRFRVQLKHEPAKTITSHISKDGHYYIHYDPTQCRSLTVREAARIQTFPDNYYFCGPRTSQYVQVGNAVPPLLAYQIAAIVFKIINNK